MPPDRLAAALEAIAAWRADPAGPVACPLCGQERLLAADHSARPWAEWYRLRCAACGLDHTLQIPLRPPECGSD